MTIDEMRILHRTALVEAEAKRTELRLVLASRYRELVGSSVEVIHMRERADELNDLVVALPALVEKMNTSAEAVEETSMLNNSSNVNVAATGIISGKFETAEGMSGGALSMRDNNDRTSLPQYRRDYTGGSDSGLVGVRGELSRLPRDIHRCLDENSVHGAAAMLISLFDIIASCSDSFPLATALSLTHTQIPEEKGTENKSNCNANSDPILSETQMKMVYLHVQTLPARTVKLARQALLQSAAKRGAGAHATAAALSALDLLDKDRHKKWMSTTTRLAPSSISSSIFINESSSARGTKLIELYYDSKAQLLTKLLNRLTLPSVTMAGVAPSRAAVDAINVTNAAESILSKIVLILQYDVILYPYQIFVLRKFPVNVAEGGGIDCTAAAVNAPVIIDRIMSTLPTHFDPDVLKSKASRFLAAHLPLIRTKVKSVLVIIAGTTASKLGHIRQALYDKTDGAECMAGLDDSGICTWDEAVSGMVDVRVVSHGTSFATMAMLKGSGGNMDGQTHITPQAGPTATSSRRFSLWGALFSNTFSSLVHSLLTSSFHSVHVRAMSTLRLSLARAPPFEAVLPHEAHQNALRIASDLDASLRRVSDDAHKLLVHAEERVESEQRLRQSLYVQTCEIMGRLLNELRRMLEVGRKEEAKITFGEEEETTKKEEDATKVLIVGRLCHLLKFRLRSLPTLLDPMSSPASLAAGPLGGGGTGAIKSSSGMITLVELSGSFDLADDDDDGLISFDEAMEAMESAFSGTHFHGAEMVRDTLLLSHSPAPGDITATGKSSYSAGGGVSFNTSDGIVRHTPAPNVTLSELALLSARGLLHDASGPQSALGTIQSSLDNIVHRCFQKWARAALSPPLMLFSKTLRERIRVATTVSDMEWKQLNGLVEKVDNLLSKDKSEIKENLRGGMTMVVGEVSPYVVSYILAVASFLNQSVCPADSLPPVPSLEHARALGISLPSLSHYRKEIPSMMVLIRGSLLGEAMTSLSESLKREITSTTDDGDSSGDVIKDNKNNDVLCKCSPSSLIHFTMDVQFIKRCFFERNQHGFLLASNPVNDSKEVINNLSVRLSESLNNALKNGLSSPSSSVIESAISKRHFQVFTSCDLFLSSLLGEDKTDKSTIDHDGAANTIKGELLSVPSSHQSFIISPLPSSRRFILLPIQAEKSLSELQLRGKYGKKGSQEEKGANSSHNKDAIGGLGTGFGFLSSMLTKTR